MTLHDLYQEFEAIRLAGVTRNTRICHQVEIRRIMRLIGNPEVSGVTASVAASVVREMQGQGLAVPTINKTLRHLRAWMKYATAQRYLTVMPEIQKLRENQPEPHAFLINEIDRLLAACDQLSGGRRTGGVDSGLWWKTFIRTQYETGGRVAAVLAIRSRSIDLATRSLVMPADHQKQKVAQRVTVSAMTLDMILQTHPQTREWIWQTGLRTDRHRVPTSLYRRFRELCQIAGVDIGHGTGCLFHRLRKSTASYLEAAGGDATRQLGHSCRNVTRRYLDPRIVGGCDAVQRIPALEQSNPPEEPHIIRLPWVGT